MTENEFIEMLKRHDWYYLYSDSQEIYRKGENSRAKINSVMEKQPELKKIYEKYIDENL